ncbi:MerR family transcriptional regulator [Streptomyces malaysiensis]|uniref:MerR family transcriptional regulator n=1 Tax=Streptomyces malaysiensis TaxID=92644 RepID=UPI000BFF2CAC|nr:MerR family transcriptional regulator [Streptomyces malaysiensis]ATL85230.1 hypothetical protein SMALA_5000 [Streptomyces malaysiensis]
MSAIPHEVAHLAGEDFFSAPVRTGASISPDGTRIAYLAPWRERLNVWVESGDSDEEARCVTTDDNRSVHTYHWTDDPRWLLYELDTATGDRTMLAEYPGQVAGWLCTPDGELYTHTRTVDGDIELARWEARTGTLCPVTTFDGADYPLGVQPFQLTPDGTGAWIGSKSLPSPLIRDRRTGELLGVRYLGERQVIHPLDPHLGAVLENLEKLSDGDLSTLSSDVSGQRWVVAFTHDRDPGVTYYYDHPTGESRLLLGRIHECVHPLAFRALSTPADPTPFTAARARHPPRRRDRVDGLAFEPREGSMAWSTREIAEIAGTTLRAVRHYHEVGLLEEPERRANGYKQYGVAHLIRVLRIKRLTDLGFSLSQIAAMGDLDDQPEEALRALDTELAATIERLRRARIELGLILRQAATTDLPSEFAPAAAEAQLSDVDRSFIVVMTRILGPQGLRAYSGLLRSRPTYPLASKFAALPADADEQTRQDLAERTAPYVRALHAEHPGLRNAHADAPGGAHFAAQTIGKAIEDLYNPAQLDVLRRLQPLLHAAPDPPHPPARRALIDTA